MSSRKQRQRAIMIVVVMVLAAVLLGAGTTLRRLARPANNAYAQKSSYGYDLDYDFGQIAGNADNLLAVYRAYLPEDNAYLKDIKAIADNIREAPNGQAKYEQVEALYVKVESLLKETENITLSEESAKYKNQALDGIKSHRTLLSQSNYNIEAQNYNKLLEGFPAGLLSKITFVRPLAVFERGGDLK